MNNERLIMLENVSGQRIGLRDTQGRTYRLDKDGKIRISEVSLQDILDYQASKVFFDREWVKIHNADADKLYSMGLTEDEINKYLAGERKAVVITKAVEEVKEETIIPVEEPVKEEVVETPIVEEVKVVEKAPKASATVKKPAAKKPSSKNRK